MTFADLLTGDAVFMDANAFVYHFAPDPVLRSPCSQLLQRIENQEIAASTSTAILSEVGHRLMSIEARNRLGWSSGKTLARLKQNPTVVQSLTHFRTALQNILQSKIQILTIAPLLIDSAAIISQQTGLLTNDALIVAVMQANSLTKLASNDTDFDRVPGLTRYAPA